MNMLNFLKVKEYYKNLLIYLPLLFIGQFFNLTSLINVSIGFILLCTISSFNYIINDIIDKERDKHHPEKKNRPVASGQISIISALIFAILLFSLSVISSYLLDPIFAVFIVLLSLSSLLYSAYFKHILYLDIIFIAINFVLRPLSGAFIVFPGQTIRISPWLILVPFFLALFLATAKRRANLIHLNKAQLKYNSTLRKYDNNTTSFLFSSSTILLIMSYAIFTIFSDYPLLIITLPVALYLIFTYRQEVESGDLIGRDFSKIIYNKKIIFSGSLLAIVAFVIMYII